MMKFSDGSHYEGDFHDDQTHGYGKYIWGNKKEYEGQWEFNVMHGKGVSKWPDNRIFDGE
jgi:hypothetical protein